MCSSLHERVGSFTGDFERRTKGVLVTVCHSQRHHCEKNLEGGLLYWGDSERYVNAGSESRDFSAGGPLADHKGRPLSGDSER